nr:DNA polymerase III subunit gamma and tau [Nakamurella aerolata]
MALYRKYRPATFAEVVGQEHVTEPLRTALAAGRINHAYLFSGPRGCGKTSSARILARSLNCVKGPTPDPCGECPSCIALAPEGPGSLDVVELDAASHGGVEDTRELRDRAFYMPAESRYRVFIIDEAHMVTTQGFNALLKIVEEPPEHLVFIFATTEPDKVLTTIRSRTHHYPFRLIPPQTMRGLLERLTADEGVTVDPAVYPLVIRAGGGSARDSLSVLDQLLAGAGPEGVTYPHAVALLGVTDAALLDEMVDALAADDGASVFGAVDKVVEAGHDPRRFAADLLQRLRDLLILDAVPDAAEKGLLDAPDDELAAMAAQAERLGRATLSRMADVVHTGLTDMRGTTAPRLVLELMCARMLLPAVDAVVGGPGGSGSFGGAGDPVGSAGLLQRLERMERRLSIAAPSGSRAGQESSPETPAEPSAGSATGRAAGVGTDERAHPRSGARQQVSDGRATPATVGGAAEAPASGPPAGVGVPDGQRPAGQRPAARDQAARDQAEHDQRERGQADREQAPLDHAAREQAAREQTAREQTAPEQAERGRTAPGQAGGGQAARGQATPEQAAPEQAERSRTGRAAAVSAGQAAPQRPGSLLPPPPTLRSDRPAPAARPQADGSDNDDSDNNDPDNGDSDSGVSDNTDATPAAAAPRSDGASAAAGQRHGPDGVAAADGEIASAATTSTDRAADRPGGIGVTDVRKVWSEVLEAVKRRRRTTQILLESATVAAVDGNTLVLTMPHAGMAKRVVEAANADLLSAALNEILGVDWTIRCEAGGAENRGAATGSRQAGGSAQQPTTQQPTAQPDPASVRPPRAQRRQSDARPAAPGPDSDDTPLPPEPDPEDAPPDDGYRGPGRREGQQRPSAPAGGQHPRQQSEQSGAGQPQAGARRPGMHGRSPAAGRSRSGGDDAADGDAGEPARSRPSSSRGRGSAGLGAGPGPDDWERDLPDDVPDDWNNPDPQRPAVVHDPEQAAIELLASELGARKLDLGD